MEFKTIIYDVNGLIVGQLDLLYSPLGAIIINDVGWKKWKIHDNLIMDHTIIREIFLEY